ncbi:5'-methylthioadenosine/S-adenosylhomocysteine nucleosidase [Legionella dresdenensis]|uniref:adenosylhomocysteine nucleosidase n=1 Tax=Legionella dresdenensis TaxID=450200 RepID=A0ABV8CGH0_9GAMM
MRIIILGAFQDELPHIISSFSNLKEMMVSKCRCLAGQWNSHDVFIALSGIGTTASAITTTILCENLQPDLIIFCGVAGGLKQDQQIGDLVLANKIIDADLYLLPKLLKDTPYKNALIDPHTLKTISSYFFVNNSVKNLIDNFSFEHLKQGVIVTSNTFPAPKSLFEEIKSLNCSAIEMESAGVYKTVEYYNIPVITIRAISNLLDECGNDLGTHPDALQLCSERLAACLMRLLPKVNDLIAVDKISKIDWCKSMFQSKKTEGSDLNPLATQAGVGTVPS